MNYLTFLANAISDPSVIVERIWPGRKDDQVLHISPGKVGIGFEGQGTNTSC